MLITEQRLTRLWKEKHDSEPQEPASDEATGAVDHDVSGEGRDRGL